MCRSFNSSTIKICRRDLDAQLRLPASCCTSSLLSVCYLSSCCSALCCLIWFVDCDLPGLFRVQVIFKSLTWCKNANLGPSSCLEVKHWVQFSVFLSQHWCFFWCQGLTLFTFKKREAGVWFQYIRMLHCHALFVFCCRHFFLSFHWGFKWKSHTFGYMVWERRVKNLPSDLSDRAHARRRSFSSRKFQNKHETLTHRYASLLHWRHVETKQTKLEKMIIL